VSAGLTEVGLNIFYRALKNLSFAAQGLYRRAGATTGDAGEVTLDFGSVDLNLLNLQEGRIGVRGGRIKNPWGLYNETRDVAFTHPTIILPLTYFERSRTLMLATNGGQLYADYNTSLGNLSFKFNYGWVNGLISVNSLHLRLYSPTKLNVSPLYCLAMTLQYKILMINQVKYFMKKRGYRLN
jgi:hypothetical protein